MITQNELELSKLISRVQLFACQSLQRPTALTVSTSQKAVIECEREVDIRLAVAPGAQVELSFELTQEKARVTGSVVTHGVPDSHESKST